ncbi:hypothetical protein EP232_03135 [bacterium]|nr:MAG: hypothetical protein EP232_03135 [bacterium]
MSKTAVHLALIESASPAGIQTRRRYLHEHGPHELGWSYINILDVEKRLQRQIVKRGFFRLYLYAPSSAGGSVTHWLQITHLRTFRSPEVFNDPVDGRRYLVHSRMTIDSIEDLEREMTLDSFRSADRRKPDHRHLELGFLFVVDPVA